MRTWIVGLRDEYGECFVITDVPTFSSEEVVNEALNRSGLNDDRTLEALPVVPISEAGALVELRHLPWWSLIEDTDAARQIVMAMWHYIHDEEVPRG